MITAILPSTGRTALRAWVAGIGIGLFGFAWAWGAPAAPSYRAAQAGSAEVYSEHCTQDGQAWKGLLRVLEEQFGEAGGKVSPTSNLVEELDLDELDFVELVMAVSEEFEIEIPDEVAEALVTAGDWCGYIEKRDSRAR